LVWDFLGRSCREKRVAEQALDCHHSRTRVRPACPDDLAEPRRRPHARSLCNQLTDLCLLALLYTNSPKWLQPIATRPHPNSETNLLSLGAEHFATILWPEWANAYRQEAGRRGPHSDGRAPMQNCAINATVSDPRWCWQRLEGFGLPEKRIVGLPTGTREIRHLNFKARRYSCTGYHACIAVRLSHYCDGVGECGVRCSCGQYTSSVRRSMRPRAQITRYPRGSHDTLIDRRHMRPSISFCCNPACPC